MYKSRALGLFGAGLLLMGASYISPVMGMGRLPETEPEAKSEATVPKVEPEATMRDHVKSAMKHIRNCRGCEVSEGGYKTVRIWKSRNIGVGLIKYKEPGRRDEIMVCQLEVDRFDSPELRRETITETCVYDTGEGGPDGRPDSMHVDAAQIETRPTVKGFGWSLTSTREGPLPLEELPVPKRRKGMRIYSRGINSLLEAVESSGGLTMPALEPCRDNGDCMEL